MPPAPRFGRLARAAAVALFAAAAPVRADAQDYSYAFRVTPSDGDAFSGTVRVAGGRARVDAETRDGDKHARDYLLLDDGGRSVTVVNPRERSYSVTTGRDFEQIIGTAMRAVDVAMTNKLTDVRVETERLGAGDTIAGYPTQRYRLTQEFTTNIAVLGFGTQPEYHVVITDFWAAPGLKLMRNPLVEMLATAETALAQSDRSFVARSAAARNRLFEGMPLRLIVAGRSLDPDGAKNDKGDGSRLMIEVTRVVRGPVDRAALDLPRGYEKRSGPLSWKFGSE
jgi:hypothetical protein